MVSQDELKEHVLPLIKEEGTLYEKQTNVLARRAIAGESVRTVTDSGLETVNKAEEGDFIVVNKTIAGEAYILKPSVFKEKYSFFKTGEGAFDEYEPKGKVIALELTKERMARLGFSDPFYFEAPWKEPMKAGAGDFLATPPDYSEVYRIGRKEFFETYGR